LGETLAALHQLFASAPRGHRRFSTARALRSAIGFSAPKREVTRIQLGPKTYKEVLRSGIRFGTKRLAVLEAVRKFGRNKDGKKTPGRLFHHVFGRRPLHRVDYRITRGMVVFILSGAEPPILASNHIGTFFPDNSHLISAQGLRGAVAVIVRSTRPDMVDALLHEGTHQFFNLHAHANGRNPEQRLDELTFMVKHSPCTRKNIRAFNRLARRYAFDCLVKDELLAQLREGRRINNLKENVVMHALEEDLNSLTSSASRPWKRIVADSFGRGAVANARRALRSINLVIGSGVEPDVVYHTMLATPFEQVPETLRALAREWVPQKRKIKKER